MPQKGPPAMTISFSGSSHFVFSVTASQMQLGARKAAAAGEFLYHILGDGAFLKLIVAVFIAEADVKCLF